MQIQSPGAPRPPTIERLTSRYPDDTVHHHLGALKQYGAAVEDPDLWLEAAVTHGFKDVPIERVTRCACGSTEHRRMCRFIFWNLLGFRECAKCGVLFVSPRLTSAAIERIFEGHYFDASAPSYWDRRRYPVFRDVHRHLRRLGVRSVFDVGAAYGHFVRWLKDRGMSASGCDISADVASWGRKHLGVDVLHGSVERLDLDPERFEAVVSLDTLYYSDDPVRDLRAMRRLVIPGGHVILRLRNGLRSRRRALAEARKPIGEEPIPAGHLWAFTPNSVVRLLRLAGLKPTLVEPAAYSRTVFSPMHAVLVALNRAAAKYAGARIRTMSFNVVARRAP